ncbi:MAG TPA: AAA family ATPase [Solirubrobacteraceae bacterium]|nr:AAA family ATPase [Solirubrobacteraceae bacterium]
MARVSVPELVGRRAELAALVVLASTRDTRLVVVDGDAGVGKTRLVLEFARRTDATVLTGGCLQFEAAIPYAPFVEALPGVLTGAGQDRGAEYLGVAKAITAAGPRVVLIIEDLHWADAATRDLLRYLHRALADAPVLVVVTCRADEFAAHHPVATLLAELTRSPHTRRLHLAPLDRDGVAALATAVLGATPPAELVDTLVTRAEGNPFFTEELLAAGNTVPRTVREIIVTRLARLPAPAQRLARLASVVGRTVPHDLLAALAPGDDLDAAVRDLVDHGQLVLVDPDAYAFRHALIHESLYRELLPGERRQAHAAVARCLAAHPELAVARGVVAAELAHHWDAANEPAPALAAAVRAASAAADALAPAAAHAHYERALRRWPEVPDPVALAGIDHDTLLERAAETASLAGHNQRAVELTRQRLTVLADPERVAGAYEQLSYQARSAGNWELARHASAETVRLLPADSPARLRVESWQMMLDMLAARHLDAVGRAERILAQATEDDVPRNRALTVLGAGHVMMGHVEEGMRFLREHREFGHRTGVPRFIGVGYVNMSESLIWADRQEEALALARTGIERAGSLGFDIYLLPIVGNAVRALAELSRWDEAVDASGDPNDPAADPFNWVFVDLPRAEILVRRGELDAAADLLKRIGAVLDGQDDAQYGSELAHLRARLAGARGQWAPGWAAVRDGLELALPAQDLWLVARLVATGVWLAAAEGADPAAADELLATGQRHRAALTARGVVALPRTLRAYALAEAERTRLNPRPDPLVWSALDGGPDRYVTAYARFRAAEALLSAKGSRSRAAALLAEAGEIATALGAAPLAEQAATLGARAGLAPATGSSSVPGLTARETEIFTLVGRGLTNAEIAAELYISTKTASVHVSNILRKLGVKSRIQAAALAHRQERG